MSATLESPRTIREIDRTQVRFSNDGLVWTQWEDCNVDRLYPEALFLQVRTHDGTGWRYSPVWTWPEVWRDWGLT